MRDLRDIEFGIGFVGDGPPDRIADRARWLEEAGVDYVWVADERFFRDPWVLMSWIGSVTSRVRIGPMVTDPFVRHPALTANAIATLDDATNGRAVLGLGAGISGFEALGIKRLKPAVALREAVSLTRSLLGGEHVDVDGESISFRDAGLNWTPFRVAPIYIAGRGPRILELAGEIADGVVMATFASGEPLEYAHRRVDAGLGRRPSGLGDCKKVSWVYTCVGRDSATARRAVRKGVAVALWGSLPILKEIGIELPDKLTNYMKSRPYSLAPDVITPAAEMIPESVVHNLSVTGTPEECAEQIAHLVDRGTDQVAIWPFAEEGKELDDTVERFVKQVMPLVNG